MDVKNKTVEKVKLCPKCGCQNLIYSPGIDIGLMHAVCMNCGYKAPEGQFPDIDKEKAKTIHIISGEKLSRMKSRHAISRTVSKWMMIAIAVIIIISLLVFVV